ncbi:MAG: type IV secretion system DNA-binding domain-containing protein [Nitrospinae bacterium]|nr:type IV secretion system DNA-binding domain-containing protein [Nitrospinota bacterium]
MIGVKELNRSIKDDGLETRLDIGGVRIPKDLEQRHFFIIGMQGVGKTTCMSQVLDSLKNCNDDNCRGIVYCYKPGDYFAKFYNPKRGDILFNPLDERSIGWNLFSEIKTEMDIDTISSSLIPDAYQQDPFWHQAARGVFSGILHYCYANNLKTNSDIWMNVTAEIQKIAEKLKQTKGGEAGYSYIQDAGKQAGSVISTMLQYVHAFRYMTDKSDNFSISDWLERGRGWLFITNYSSIKDTLRPMLSLFVDLVGTKLLSMRDDKKRRIFFLLDEFSSLQKIATLHGQGQWAALCGWETRI